MNTMPDEEMLALWVEDELQGASAAEVDAWAVSQPEWLTRREDARQMKALFRRANIPAAEEPPYADFFNSRISREIAREALSVFPSSSPSPSGGRRSFFSWLLPATAVAGMALCFWAGTRLVPAAPTPVTVAAPPVLYTPEKGVNAEYFASADAEIIVLDGVAAIPDTFELPETASTHETPPATADIDLPTP
jgi:hypothetical protein